jgi:hypothetical protein
MTEPTTEAAIMRHILVALSDAGCLAWRANVGRFRMEDGRWFDTGLPVGFSDIMGIAPDGRPLFVEVKKPGGRVSVQQQRFIEAVRSRGARAGVAYSVADAQRIALA